MNLARHIDEGLTIGAGVFMLLWSFRIVGKRPGVNVRFDDWHERNRRLMLAAGVLTIAAGGFRLLLSSPTTPVRRFEPDSLVWQAVTSSDGVITVKMPGPPRLETRNEQGPLGSTKFVKQSVAINEDAVIFSLNERHYLDETLEFDRDRFLDASAKATVAQANARLLGERELQRGAIAGKEITIDAPHGYTVVMQFFLVGRSAYQLKVVVPESMRRSPMVGEFFDSFVVRQDPANRKEGGNP